MYPGACGRPGQCLSQGWRSYGVMDDGALFLTLRVSCGMPRRCLGDAAAAAAAPQCACSSAKSLASCFGVPRRSGVEASPRRLAVLFSRRLPPLRRLTLHLPPAADGGNGGAVRNINCSFACFSSVSPAPALRPPAPAWPKYLRWSARSARDASIPPIPVPHSGH